MMKLSTVDGKTVGKVGEGWNYTDVVLSPIFGGTGSGVGGMSCSVTPLAESRWTAARQVYGSDDALGTFSGFTSQYTNAPNGNDLQIDNEFTSLDVDRSLPPVVKWAPGVSIPVDGFASAIAQDEGGNWISQGSGVWSTDSVIPTTGLDTDRVGIISRYDSYTNFLYDFDGSNGANVQVLSIGVYKWISGSNLYVLLKNDTINVFVWSSDTTVPTYVRTISSHGTGATQLDRASAITVDTRGYVWICDNGNATVKCLKPDGTTGSTFFMPSGGHITTSLMRDITFTGGTSICILSALPADPGYMYYDYSSTSAFWHSIPANAQSSTVNMNSYASSIDLRSIAWDAYENHLYIGDGGASTGAGRNVQPIRILEYYTFVGGTSGEVIHLDGYAAPRVSASPSRPSLSYPDNANVHILGGRQDSLVHDMSYTAYYGANPQPMEILTAYVRSANLSVWIETVYIDWYGLSLNGVPVNGIFTPGWSGNVWGSIKDFCNANGLLMLASNGKLNFVNVIGVGYIPESQPFRFMDIRNASGFRYSVSSQAACQYVNVTNLNIRYQYDGFRSDATRPWLWDAISDGHNQIIQVDAGSLTTTTVGDGRVFMATKEILFYDTVIPSVLGPTGNVYSAVDSLGTPIANSDWTSNGGTVTVQAGSQSGYIDITVNGPSTAMRGYTAPFYLATGSDAGQVASLTVGGTGVVTDPVDITVDTGIVGDRARSDTRSISSPFLTTYAKAYTALSWNVARAGRGLQTLSFSLPNPVDSTGLAKYVFGMLNNRYLKYDSTIYIVTSATFTEGIVQVTAERYTTAGQYYDRWKTISAGAVASAWAGYTAEEQAMMPLR